MNNITVKKLNVQFGEEKILNNVSYQFIENKVYAILGKSGSGKTTFLNCLAGLLENYNGSVLFNGQEIKNIKETDNRFYQNKIICYIHQELLANPKLTIEENFAIPCLLEIETRSINQLEANIPYKQTKRISKLSGGEQKRVDILTSLNKDCKVILADEPTSNLDSKNSDLIMSYLKQKAKNKIFIFVTHDEKIAQKYADEIIIIKDGKIEMKDKLQRLKNETIESTEVKEISILKSKKVAKKYVQIEKEFSGSIVSISITLLFCVGMLFALSFGIFNFFNEQLKMTDKLTDIYITKNNNLEKLNDKEINELKKKFPEIVFYKNFKNKEIINAKANDIDIQFPGETISHPFISCPEISDDELILTINDEYKDYLQNKLEIEDLEDLFFDSSIKLNISTKENELEFQIIDIFYDNGVNYVEFNALDPNIYLIFNEANQIYFDCIEKDSISENFLNFIGSSSIYNLSENNNSYIIEKYDEEILSFDVLNSKYQNSIPLFEDNQNIPINYYNGLLYFNNTDIYAQDNKIENVVYYSPYINEIQEGRNVETEDEVIISKGLANLFGSDCLYNKVSLGFNSQRKEFTVVGVTSALDLTIYQQPSWFSYLLNDSFNVPRYQRKTNEFIIFTSAKEVKNTYDEISKMYPEFSTFSSVVETINNIGQISNYISIGSVIVSIIMIALTISSIIILFLIEKKNNEKQINQLKDFGLINKDFNKILLHINLRRFLKSTIISIILIYLFCYLTNMFLIKEELFSNELMSCDLIILIIIVITNFVCYCSAYLASIYKDKKEVSD